MNSVSVSDIDDMNKGVRSGESEGQSSMKLFDQLPASELVVGEAASRSASNPPRWLQCKIDPSELGSSREADPVVAQVTAESDSREGSLGFI
jgi:hypothetical protein